MTDEVLDLSEFENKQVRKGQPCKVTVLALSDEQRAKLNKAILAPHIRHATISTVLEDWGFDIDPQAISHHRRGIRGEPNGCKCEPIK